MRFGDLINIDEKLKTLIPYQKTDAVFFDFFFDLRFEVFAIEARTLRGSGHISAAREQHFLWEAVFYGLTNQG